MSEQNQNQNNIPTETIQAKPQKRIWKCKTCGKEFNTLGELRSHVWEHTRERKQKQKPTTEIKKPEINKPTEKREIKEEVIKPKEQPEIIKKFDIKQTWEKIKWYVVGIAIVLVAYLVYREIKKRRNKQNERRE